MAIPYRAGEVPAGGVSGVGAAGHGPYGHPSFQNQTNVHPRFVYPMMTFLSCYIISYNNGIYLIKLHHFVLVCFCV